MWPLVTLGGGGVTLFALFFLFVLAVVVLNNTGPGNLQACAPNVTTGKTEAGQAKATNGSIPRNYLKLYQETGQRQNIPWNVLAAIGKIETDHGRSTLPGVLSGENYAGAGGPMQFLSASWKAYGADGDGDGKRDRYNPADAILGAANHLRGSIGKKDPSKSLSSREVRMAVHRYNPGNYDGPHDNPYAQKVLAQANRYAEDHDLAPANYAGTAACSAALTLGDGPFGRLIADAAAYWAEKAPGTPQPPKQASNPTPYSWGGGRLDGPGGGIQHGAGIHGFDCSGLVRHAVYQASGEKITLPRTTYAMWDGDIGTKIPPGRPLAPGDLVFFRPGPRGPEHVGIYYGEVKGVRWMVEAWKTGTNLKFTDFDSKSKYMGAIRISPPPE